jgi:hypothetical protein
LQKRERERERERKWNWVKKEEEDSFWRYVKGEHKSESEIDL